jgi:hypothetical protein
LGLAHSLIPFWDSPFPFVIIGATAVLAAELGWLGPT